MNIIRKLRLISIADIFTMANGVFGLLAAISFVIFHPDITIGTALIFAGIICDGADGFMARKFGTKHDYGRYLDSISDSITFGVAPAVLVIVHYYNTSPSDLRLLGNSLTIAAGLMVVTFAWYRLYRFSVEGYKYSEFCGLATPAMTFFVLVNTHILTPDSDLHIFLALGLTIMASIMMVMPKIRYPKLRGGLEIAVALVIVITLITIQMLKTYSILGEKITWIVYWALTYMALGIMIGYVFISPIYMMFGMEGDDGR